MPGIVEVTGYPYAASRSDIYNHFSNPLVDRHGLKNRVEDDLHMLCSIIYHTARFSFELLIIYLLIDSVLHVVEGV